MAVSPVDILIFAPLAPILGVLLFWFIQLVFIESQKYLLSKIRPKHEPFCNFTNFIGILFQTICHALGYTVTRSGISQFQLNIYYGRVKPKKEKTGIFEWISNSFLFLGPFFIPAALLLICLFFLINGGFETTTAAEYTFAEGMINFGSNLYSFSKSFFSFLFTMDLLHPAQLGFLLLLIFLGLGIRPSYIVEEQRRKVDMVYDLKNIKSHILLRPLYIILLFLLAYVIFYVSLLLSQSWYSNLFSIFGWLSIISIVSLIVAHLLTLLIKIADNIPKYWKMLLYLTIPISYVVIRLIFYFFPSSYTTTISLLFTIFLTVIVTILLLKFKTNKFKSKTEMKKVREMDEPK